MSTASKQLAQECYSPGALDFEMEKNSRKLIFLEKLLEGA